MAARETVRVGVVGVGNAGRGHLGHYRKMHGVEVVGVADVDLQRAEQAAREFEVPRAYRDYVDLFTEGQLDGVTVTVPPYLHREVVLRAAQARINVHCEKPLCLTLEDADAMIAACRDNAVILYVSFEPRQLGSFRRVREMVAGGLCGRPLWLLDRRFLPATPGVWMPPTWFWRRELGGGLLIEHAGHHFDYIRWIFGEVDRVWAHATTIKFSASMPPHVVDPNIEDMAMITMEHRSGALSHLLDTCIVPCGNMFHLEVATETHYLQIDRTRHLVVEREGRTLLRAELEGPDREVITTQHFVDCIRQGLRPDNTGEDGRAALELSLAALESARTERPVALPLPRTPEHFVAGLTAAAGVKP